MVDQARLINTLRLTLLYVGAAQVTRLCANSMHGDADS